MPPTIFQTKLDARLAPADLLEAVAEIQLQKETAAEKHVIEAPRIVTAWIEKRFRIRKAPPRRSLRTKRRAGTN